MKTQHNIKHLIDLYYAGESTVAQEQELLLYFQQEEIAEELKDEQIVFLAMHKNDEIKIPANLKTKLIESLNKQINHKENLTKTKRLTPLYWNSLVAASLILFIGYTLIWKKPKQKNEYTSFTKEEIYKIQEAEKALILLSTKYNQGIEELEKSTLLISQSNKLLVKHINKLP